MTRVIGVGAGGHAKVAIDALHAGGEHVVAGLLDSNPNLHGKTVLGVTVLGGDDMLTSLRDDGIDQAFLGVGTVGRPDIRVAVVERVSEAGLAFVPIIHPEATVAESAMVAAAPTIFARAVINADARLGNHVIINTGAIVEHDCQLGDHSHLATGASLAGNVQVGAGAHIGAGAVVHEGITIGTGAMVGAGAAVVRDVDDAATVVGVPARTFGGTP